MEDKTGQKVIANLCNANHFLRDARDWIVTGKAQETTAEYVRQIDDIIVSIFGLINKIESEE